MRDKDMCRELRKARYLQRGFGFWLRPRTQEHSLNDPLLTTEEAYSEPEQSRESARVNEPMVGEEGE